MSPNDSSPLPSPSPAPASRLWGDESGMTLIEIMAVITILGIIMTIVGVSVIGQVNQSRADATRIQMSELKGPLTKFKLDHGQYPSTSEGLQALITPPPGRNNRKFAAYIDGSQPPTDAWGNPFQYYSPGTHGNNDYEIISLGADGKDGGEAVDSDINSWE